MSFITTLTGQQYYIQTVLNSDVLRLRLFTNDLVPSKTDEIDDYTEASYSGYAAKLLTPSDWVIAVDGLTGDYVATFPKQSWTITSTVVICGYYVTDSTNTKVYWAERFPQAPISVTTGPVSVTPTIGFK